MPYTKMSQVNKAVRGIDPPVTLAQANEIAERADALEQEGKVDSPWAVAIWYFQNKSHKVSDDSKGWVKRESTKESPSKEEQEAMVGVHEIDILEYMLDGLRLEEMIERLEKCLALKASITAQVAATHVDQDQLINLEKYSEAAFDTLQKRGDETDPSWVCGFWCQGPESKTGDGLTCYLNLSGARESIRNGFHSLPAKTAQEAIDSSYELWQASLSKLTEVVLSKTQATDPSES